MGKDTNIEIKEFKRTLKVANQRTKNRMFKVAHDLLNDRETLVYSELDIRNIDKIIIKTLNDRTKRKANHSLPTVFNNVLFSFFLDDQPACFILRYTEGGKQVKLSVCAIHIMTDVDGQTLLTIHYLNKSGNKVGHKVANAIFKIDEGNVLSYGDADNHRGKLISFGYSLSIILNKYCADKGEFMQELESEEDLSKDINDYFQSIVQDEIEKIKESEEEEFDLSTAISLLNSDDIDEPLSLASNA